MLEARNQIGGALEAAGVEVDKLQKRFAEATTTAGRLDDRLDKLERGAGKMGATFRRVNPTLEAFERRALRIAEAAKGAAGGLEKMDRRLEKVNLGLESVIKTIDRAERVVTRLEARLDELGLRKFKPEVDVKISGKEKLDALLLELQIATQKVYKAKTDVETEDAINKVEALRARLHKAGFGDQADKLLWEVDIRNATETETRLKELSAKADEAARKRDIKFTLEGEAHVKSEIQALLREIEVLKKEDVGINAILRREKFDSEYNRIIGDIALLSQSTAAPNVKLNKKQYEIEKALLLADLAHLGLKTETVSVRLDVKKGIGDRIAQIGQQIDDAIGDRGLLTSRKLTNAIINLAVAFAEPLLSAITAVGGGLIAVGASAGQAIVGIGGLATAAAAEAAPALGVLAFALNRVQNVVKAVGLAYKEQQQKGQQQISLDQARAAAADSVRSAEEGVANAQRAVIVAQEAVNKARKEGVRQIEDLMMAELRASRSAQASRLGLASAIGLGTGSVIDAQLQAQSDQTTANRARTDSRAAQAGGIEGLDSVIAAKRQLADAVRGVGDAQRQLDAAGRQAEAASARLIRSANAFQIAYKQLSEGERALFSVLHNKDNTGLLDLFQNDLDSPIRKVTDTVLFSVARMAKGITKLLTDPEVVAAFQSLATSISTVFDGIAHAIQSGPVADAIKFFIKESAKNIGPVAHIFGDLLKIFLAIAHAASGPLTSAIGSVTGFLDKLVGKVSSKEGQTSLSSWFQAALKPMGSFLKLGGAIINLFLALVGAGGAADAGTKGIDGLTRSIDKATKYINTHGKEVSKFFNDSIKALGYVGNAIVSIGKLLVTTFKADSVKDFASLINGVVLPILYTFITQLGLVVKALASWFRIPILGELTKFGLIAAGTGLIIARLAESVSGLLKLFGEGSAIRRFIGWIAGTRAAAIAAAAAQVAWNVVLAAFNLILDANPIVLAIAAIVAFGAAFYLAYKKIKPFHDAVDDVFSFIKRHWKTIAEIMLGPLGLVIAGVTKFGPRILRAFKSAFSDVFGFFKSLPGRIGDALSDGIHKIGSVFESIGERIVKSIAKGIKGAPKALLHALESVIPGGKLIGKGLDAIGLATGGRIAGNPADGDSVHVRVKPGEVILNEIQQRSVGTSAINAALTGAPVVSAGGAYATGGKAQRPSSVSTALAAIVQLADNETDDIADNFVSMRKRIEKTLTTLAANASDSWRDFWKAGDRNLSRLEDSITRSFKSIGDTVYEGFSYIQDSASRSLKSLGGKEAHFGLHRLSLSNDAVSKADGGWIGNQGERGKDRVHTILGRGEAVLNWAHQKIVDPALRAAYGFGLPEMFKRTNALHAGDGPGMASGGFAGANFFGHPSNVTPTIKRLIGTVEQRWPESVITSTTDHSTLTTSGNRSLHVDGEAFDIAGAPGYMNQMAAWIKTSGLYKNLTEGIHNPNLSVKNGEIVPSTFWGPAVWAQHANHIHLGVRGTVNAFKAASTKIRKQIVDGSGSLANLAQHAIDRLRGTAQKAVDGTGQVDAHSAGIKILAAAGGRRVGATTFGGPADPGTGVTGYRGDNLHQFPNSFAELSNPGTLDFSALGGLPYKTRLRITAPTGKSAIALKRDVGKGGPAVGGVKRGIDLWYELADKLGLGNVWSGVVKVAKAARGGFIEPVQQFAKGGIVQGALGTAQPVIAHAGELVLNSAQQSRLWKQMAAGGTVGALAAKLRGRQPEIDTQAARDTKKSLDETRRLIADLNARQGTTAELYGDSNTLREMLYKERNLRTKLNDIEHPIRPSEYPGHGKLPASQQAAFDVPDISDHRKMMLDVAKNPEPGTRIWRSEYRNLADRAVDAKSVGIHWTVNPDSVINHRGLGGNERDVVYEAVVDKPDRQIIPRDNHAFWGGPHKSMDWEAEVRLQPKEKVRVTGAWTRAEGEKPFVRGGAEGWVYQKVGRKIAVEHRNEGIGYNDAIAAKQAENSGLKGSVVDKLGRFAGIAGKLTNRLFAAAAVKDLVTGHIASGLGQAAGFIPGIGGLYATALLQAALHNNKNLPTRGPAAAKLQKQNYDAGKIGPAIGGGRLQHAPEPVAAPRPSHFAQEEIKKRSRLKKAPYKGFKQRVFAAGGIVDPGIEWGGAQAQGGDYIVKKPTVFIAGEAGPERATFKPIKAAAGFPGYPPLGSPTSLPTQLGPTLPGALPQPRQLASPHALDPPKPQVVVVQVPVASGSGSGGGRGASGGSGGSGGGSTAKAASTAAEKAKKAFQKIFDNATKTIEDAIKAANFDQRAGIAKATQKAATSFRLLAKKSSSALDVLSNAIDSMLADNGPIAALESAMTARSTIIRRRATQRQFKVTKNSGGVVAGVRTNAIDVQKTELSNLGDDRLGLQAENRILATTQADAQAGLDKAEALFAKAKGKKAKEDAKKLVEQFRGELNKTRAKREDIRGKLADNAQAIVEQQEAIQQTAYDNTTGIFDRIATGIERFRRKLTARGQAAPLRLFDQQIQENGAEIDELQKQLVGARKSGNTELMKTIQDKIDELQTSIEEIAAAKFQAQIDAVNKAADTKLSGNDFTAKLASMGVDPAAFASGGIGSLNLAQLGQPNFKAVGASLKERGGILQQQRNGLNELLAQAVASGNTDKIDDLTKQIQTLDGTMIDNAKAIRDNTDAALAAAAASRVASLDQNLSVSGAGQAYLQSITNNTGISTQAQQAALLRGNATTLTAKQIADSTSFAETISGTPEDPRLAGLVDPNKLKTLTGKDLIDYISGVITTVQGRTDVFSPDEIATIVGLGTSILTDATAVQDNTKALKDLTGSLVQSFSSTGWQRFRQAIFDGNNGLLPQYQSYIPSFSGGGTMMHDGLAMLHRNEVVLTPGEASSRSKTGDTITEETHFHITSPTEVVDPVWLARQTSFRRRING